MEGQQQKHKINLAQKTNSNNFSLNGESTANFMQIT